jgi:molybdate transport system substrate-binding protein
MPMGSQPGMPGSVVPKGQGWSYAIVGLLAAAAWLLVLLPRDQPGPRTEINVFAAASLRDVLTEVGKKFESEKGLKLRFNFAGSNVLAQQIAAAEVADIFVSANQHWMNFVDRKKRSVPGTRRFLLSNRIVVVAHASTDWIISAPQDLAELPIRFLSVGDPKAVPAGLYAKTYLSGIEYQAGSLWSFFLPRMAPAPDVRAALNLVASDPEVIGIVYHTDALAVESVRVLYEIPEDDVAPIKYFAAMISHPGDSAHALSFFGFLFSDEASRVFEAHGFIPERSRVTRQ